MVGSALRTLHIELNGWTSSERRLACRVFVCELIKMHNHNQHEIEHQRHTATTIVSVPKQHCKEESARFQLAREIETGSLAEVDDDEAVAAEADHHHNHQNERFSAEQQVSVAGDEKSIKKLRHEAIGERLASTQKTENAANWPQTNLKRETSSPTATKQRGDFREVSQQFCGGAQNGNRQQRSCERVAMAPASEETVVAAAAVDDDERGQRSGSSCAGCSEPIRDKFIFSVIDLHWHQECVQCVDCSLKLSDRCHTFEGKLYCKHDYWRRFGPKCFACLQTIEPTEIVQRIKGNRVYHLKCFTCFECNRELKSGEQLHLIDDKKLLCKLDFNQRQALQRTSCSAASKKLCLASNGFGVGFGGGGGNATGTGNGNKTAPQQQVGENGRGTETKCQTSEQASYFTLLGAAAANNRNHHKGGQLQGANMIKRSQNMGRDDVDVDETSRLFNEDDDQDDNDLAGGLGEDCADEFADEDDEQDGDELDDDEDHSIGSARGLGAGGPFGADSENEENQQQLGPVQLHGGAGCASYGAELAKGKRKRRRKQRNQLQQQRPICKKSPMQQAQQTNNGSPSAAASKRLVAAARQTSSVAARGGGESILNGPAQHATLDSTSSSSSSSSTSSSTSASSTSSSTSSSSSILAAGGLTTSNGNRQQQPAKTKSSSAPLGVQLASQAPAHLSHNHHHHYLHQQQNHQTGQQHQGGQGQGNNNSNNSSSVNASSGGGGHKPTRVRTVLNEKQLQTLRDCYALNPRPDALMKEQLVEMTGLSSRVIRVWFQNKRCKDKKKSILYKQMQQHEKDGRHLAGLTLMRGVPMVASSPVQYNEQPQPSSAAATGGVGAAQPNGQAPAPNPADLQGGVPGVRSPAVAAAERQQQHYAIQSVQSPTQQPQQQVDIHAYQPPWKNLIDYAHQQQQQHQAVQGAQGDRLNAASPRYKQLIGQIHGYNNHQTGERLTPPAESQAASVAAAAAAAAAEQQQAMFEQHQQRPEQAGYAPLLGAGLMQPLEQLGQVGPPLMQHHAHLATLGPPQTHQQQQQPRPTGLQMGGHMHQFQR